MNKFGLIVIITIALIYSSGCTTIERMDTERQMKDDQYKLVNEFNKGVEKSLNDLEQQKERELYEQNPSIEKENMDLNHLYLVKHLVSGEDSGVFLVNDGDEDKKVVLYLNISHFSTNKLESESAKKVLVSIIAHSQREIIRECLPPQNEQSTFTQGFYKCDISLYNASLNLKNHEFVDFRYVPQLPVMGFENEELFLIEDYNKAKQFMQSK